MIENNEKQKIILPQYILITLYTFTCVLQIAMFVYLHIFKYSIQTDRLQPYQVTPLKSLQTRHL